MTERRRIACEIMVIRVALKKCGYSIHKRARQAIWKVYITDDRFYVLTFQPAPISSWVLHPHDNSPDRCAIETIIGRALEKQPPAILGRVP